ncbi:MAG: hypothetical protein IJA26_07335 [Clostridia bacterium]|nr:hypothetical protein [Clostridia bacterium]
MKYTMLLWPHSNVRYQNETMKLAKSELELMLECYAPEAAVCAGDDEKMPALTIEMPEKMPEELIKAIGDHSLLYVLFENREGGMLLPVQGRNPAYVGSDLPGILKYKGKTNELFLQLLINAALYAGKFAKYGSQRPMNLLDPMCGRGTTLFVGANRGWHTTGSDVDKTDLSEAEKFLRRYFEYHRMKHTHKRSSRTVQGEKPAQVSEFTFADTPEHFKAGETCTLRLTNADAAKTKEVFGAGKFEMIVCDLPYGVQHASVGSSPEKLLEKALPGWKEALKRGGSIAVSFNAQSLKREKVLELMEKAGLEAKRGGAYENFSHWVEQAVTRDIAVAVKKSEN